MISRPSAACTVIFSPALQPINDRPTGELSDIPRDNIHVDSLPELPEGTVSDGLEVIVKIKNK